MNLGGWMEGEEKKKKRGEWSLCDSIDSTGNRVRDTFGFPLPQIVFVQPPLVMHTLYILSTMYVHRRV